MRAATKKSPGTGIAVLVAAWLATSVGEVYSAPGEAEGPIRIWASAQDAKLVEKWEAAFRKQHARVDFKNTWHGPESTLAGVYTGVADIAFLARELRQPVERMAYQWVFRYPPFALTVANAGFSATRESAQLAFFVHADNPLDRLTLTQLDHVLDTKTEPARTWGDLGLDGAWKSRPLHVIGPPVDSVAALHVRDTVMHGSRKWNPAYTEYPDAAQIVAAFAKDAQAISYLPVDAVPAGAKILALGSGSDFVKPDRDTIRSGSYPLRRTVEFVINRAPGTAINPTLREFLDFVLGAQGQALIEPADGLVELSDVAAKVQRERLQ